MADYKQLLELTNALTQVSFESLTKMGLNIPLIFNEFSEAFRNNGVTGFLQNAVLLEERSTFPLLDVCI